MKITTAAKNLTMGLVVGTGLTLMGCKEEIKINEVKTIDWYKIHEKGRQEMIAKCDNNPGELIDTPNCINAKTADADAAIEARRERIKKTHNQ